MVRTKERMPEEFSQQEFLSSLTGVIEKMATGESLEFNGLIFKKTEDEITFSKKSELKRELDVIEGDFPYIWERPSEIDSYWIFLLNGIHLELDKEIISEALIWKYLNPTSEVVFFQSHENIFGYLVELFEVNEWPCIIVNNDPDMRNGYIKFELDFVKEIQSVDSGTTILLTKLHTDFKNKRTLSEVRNKILKKQFWKWAKKVYDEFKEWKDLIVIFSGP